MVRTLLETAGKLLLAPVLRVPSVLLAGYAAVNGTRTTGQEAG
jgi:hypothetical protein